MSEDYHQGEAGVRCQGCSQPQAAQAADHTVGESVEGKLVRFITTYPKIAVRTSTAMQHL